MESPDKTAKELAKAARTAGRVVGRLEATEKLLRGHVQRMGERLEPGRRFVEPGFARTADEIVEEGRTLLGHDRLGVLWQAVRNSRHLDLPMLKIGAFRGGSARFLGRAWKQLSGSDARLHIIDTFVGHAAEQITGFDPHHQAGRFGGRAGRRSRRTCPTCRERRSTRARSRRRWICCPGRTSRSYTSTSICTSRRCGRWRASPIGCRRGGRRRRRLRLQEVLRGAEGRPRVPRPRRAVRSLERRHGATRPRPSLSSFAAAGLLSTAIRVRVYGDRVHRRARGWLGYLGAVVPLGRVPQPAASPASGGGKHRPSRHGRCTAQAGCAGVKVPS